MPDHKPLLEREGALELLHGSLTLAERGRGTLVMVEGVAGVGKILPLDEICAAATTRHFRILTGRGKGSGRSRPPSGAWPTWLPRGSATEPLRRPCS